MAAEDDRRETILRNAKYEKVAPAIRYRGLSHSVARFLKTRDAGILASYQTTLEMEIEAAIDPQKKLAKTHELAALQKFWAQHNEMGLAGVEAEYVSTRLPKLDLHGVQISVFPTVWLTQRRARGADLVGAAIVDVAVGVDAKKEETKARQTRAMAYTAYLLHNYVERHRCGENSKASGEHCVVYHVHRNERVDAAKQYKTELGRMEAACRTVAIQWPKLTAPGSFDPTKARYRRAA